MKGEEWMHAAIQPVNTLSKCQQRASVSSSLPDCGPSGNHPSWLPVITIKNEVVLESNNIIVFNSWCSYSEVLRQCTIEMNCISKQLDKSKWTPWSQELCLLDIPFGNPSFYTLCHLPSRLGEQSWGRRRHSHGDILFCLQCANSLVHSFL